MSPEKNTRPWFWESDSFSTRQKHIMQVVHEWNEGWLDKNDLEKRLEKLFTDKRHNPKKKS